MALAPASSGSGASSTAALTLLSTTTLASPAASIDVSSIAATYNDLIVVLVSRSAFSANTDSPAMFINNDQAGNYGYQRLRGLAATASAAESFGVGLVTTVAPAATALAGAFGVTTCTIYGYASTAWKKTVDVETLCPAALSTGNVYVQKATYLWNSTSAVDRVTWSNPGTSANFATGTQLRIYGRL